MLLPDCPIRERSVDDGRAALDREELFDLVETNGMGAPVDEKDSVMTNSS